MIQSLADLEKWHAAEDPWNYESSPQDQARKSILLGEIPLRTYHRTLDIGCGQGFITRDLPGDSVLGVDVSENAIKMANRFASPRLNFQQGSIFGLSSLLKGEQFDLVIVTGVLYKQYIGQAEPLVYLEIDKLLKPEGILISVHIDDWYRARFPYLLNKQLMYDYGDYKHCLEVYCK